MASYSSYASTMSERKLTINGFTGIDQSRGLYSADYGSSPDAVNFRTRDGLLMTAGGVSQYGVMVAVEDYLIYPKATTYPHATLYPLDIDTLHLLNNARIFQGYFRDAQKRDFSKLIMTVYGRIYAADIDGTNWAVIKEGQSTNDWTAVNYRDENVDWIIFTNGIDTPLYWDGISPTAMPLNIVQGHVDGGAGASSQGEELRFQNITLLKERLWGGVVTKYPDRIYWSHTFDPEDWELNFIDSDSDGGGYLDVATFDGSRIRAIVAAMDELLIFKDKSMHRLTGSYPGEFAANQIYGTDGTLAYRTIVNTGTAIYFLANEGLVRYSGMSAVPLSANGDKKLRELWPRIDKATIQTACAAFMDNIIYLSVPLDGSIINTHVIEYDIATGNYNIIELPGVDDWLVLREGQSETLLAISAGHIFRYNSGYTFFNDEPINASWTSPSISCGSLASKKQTGRFYMSITAASLDVNRPPEVKLSMITGRKVRTKIVKLKNGTNEIRKRVKVRGRSFRFKIENMHGDPLTIHSGVEIHIEEDYD